MQYRDVEAVAFDLFDTLITVQGLGLQEALSRLLDGLQRQGIEVDAASFLPLYREMSRSFIQAAKLDGRETHNRFWVSAALDKIGVTIAPDDARIEHAVDAYFSAFLDHAQLLPGTLEMLTELQPYRRLGLLSNFTHSPAVKAILKRLGLDEYLEIQVVSGALGYRKPHDRVFAELSHRFRVPRARIAFVGDDLQADVEGAQQAGLQPIWTTYARVYKASRQERTDDPNNPDPPAWHRDARPEASDVQALPEVATISSWDGLLALLN